MYRRPPTRAPPPAPLPQGRAAGITTPHKLAAAAEQPRQRVLPCRLFLIRRSGSSRQLRLEGLTHRIGDAGAVRDET